MSERSSAATEQQIFVCLRHKCVARSFTEMNHQLVKRQLSSAVIGCSIQGLGDGKSHGQSECLIHTSSMFC